MTKAFTTSLLLLFCTSLTLPASGQTATPPDRPAQAAPSDRGAPQDEADPPASSRSADETDEDEADESTATRTDVEPRDGVDMGLMSWSSQSSEDEPTLDLNVGGALRFNVLFEDFDDTNRGKGGEFTFDTFRVNADGTYGDLFFAAEYRFYTGYRFSKEGYVGYNFADNLSASLGVHQVPFGIQPYQSNSWFFNLQYYAGFEDDYDAGVKVKYEPGPWSLHAAYYMNAEQTSFSGGTSFERYSFDVVPVDSASLGYAGIDGSRNTQETDQFNLKVEYTIDHGDFGSTTIGASGQTGALYNIDERRSGRRNAGMVHVNGSYGRFTLRASAMQYAMNPVVPDGLTDDYVTMAGYNAPYLVASEATLYGGGVSYQLPVSVGPISSFTFYEDVSYFDKAIDSWDDGTSFITGVLTVAGPIYAYSDFLVTRNHPFSLPGPNFGSALAQGSDDWNVAFNVNLGVYF